MTTARETAKLEACRNHMLGFDCQMRKGADVASDVWEPLLQKAVAAIEAIEIPAWRRANITRRDFVPSPLLEELKEALGEVET